MLPKVYHPRALVTLVAVLNNGVGAPIAAIPRTVEWTRNSARKADTCSVMLDYRDFPLDPRILQAVHVQAHVDTLIHPDLPFVPTLLNKRFVGLADSNAVGIGEDNTVTLECRDFTGLFLDRPWPGTPIPATITLQAAVEMVRVMVAPKTLPTVFEPAAADAAATPLTVVLGKNFYEPPEDATCWDVLTDICALFGLVPVWDLDVLHVRTAARSGLGNAMFILGQNVARLSLSRDFKGASKKPVVVKCWDPVKGIALEGRWPVVVEPSVEPDTLGVPGPKQEAPVQYNVTGLYTPDDLILLARRIYDEAAEREIRGEIETRDMRDPFMSDILALSNGDTLILNVDPGYAAGIDGMTEAEAIAYLANPYRQNSLSESVAGAVVAAYKQAQRLDTTFYVAEAHHRWDRESGYSMTARFINFVFGAGL